MTRGKKIGIILSLTLLALLLVLLWLLLQRRPALEAVPQEATPAQPGPEVPAAPLDGQSSEDRAQTIDVQTLAKTFVTRYGSFSTEASYQNLIDLYPLMTDRFEAETAAFIETAEPSAEFYGVTTRVITVTVEEMDEVAGTARVLVSTQREEARGTAQNPTVRYQDIRLNLVIEGGAWKADSALWL